MADKEITLFPGDEIQTKKKKAHLFPVPFPESMRLRLIAALSSEFKHDTIDIDYAIRVCQDWSHGSGKKRLDWVAVMRNGIRKGWLRPHNGPRGAQTTNSVRGALARLNAKALGSPYEH